MSISIDHPDVNVQIIDQENKGYSAARNTGILASKGEYVCLLDADDIYYPESLALRMEAFEKFDVDFVLGRCNKVFKPTAPRINHRRLETSYPELILQTKGKLHLCDCKEIRKIVATRGFQMHSNTITYKRELLLELGMYNPDFAVNEDWELVYKTFFKLDRFVFVDEYLADYKYYMQYVNKTDHARTDINLFFQTERRRYVRMIKLLNEQNYDKDIIRQCKRRICGRKYKFKGLMAYREGKSFTALKYYFKARAFDPNDRETMRLVHKALVPAFLRPLGKKYVEYQRRKELHLENV